MQYNDSCSRSFRECVYCFSSQLKSRWIFRWNNLFSLLFSTPAPPPKWLSAAAPVLYTQMWPCTLYSTKTTPINAPPSSSENLSNQCEGGANDTTLFWGSRGWHLAIKGLLTHLALLVDPVLPFNGCWLHHKVKALKNHFPLKIWLPNLSIGLSLGYL